MADQLAGISDDLADFCDRVQRLIEGEYLFVRRLRVLIGIGLCRLMELNDEEKRFIRLAEDYWFKEIREGEVIEAARMMQSRIAKHQNDTKEYYRTILFLSILMEGGGLECDGALIILESAALVGAPDDAIKAVVTSYLPELRQA